MTPEQQPISQPQRIDRYVGQYAERAVGMVASEIRALFAVAARPEIVSLAGGSPYVSALPLDVVGDMIGQLIASQGATALQYCTAQGDAGLRERICDVMALEQIRAHPDEVVVTVGSQQALDLMARIFIDPGDVVLVEAPSYVGALGAFASYQADMVHVAMDDDGLIPEALEEAIRRVAATGRRAKFLYTVPNFHNPAGVTLAAGRRHRILDICHRAGLLVVEDNPYGLLGFDGDPMRALRADDTDGVVYLGTFSKTFAAGVRVGWAVAPTAIREKLDPGRRVGRALPLQLLAADRARVPEHPALARAGQGLPRALPGAPGRDAERAVQDDAARVPLDQAGRRVLRLAQAAGRDQRQGDAAAGDLVPGRLRAGHGLLRRRLGQPVRQALLLPPRSGPHQRGRPQARRGDRDRDAAAGRLRTALQHPS